MKNKIIVLKIAMLIIMIGLAGCKNTDPNIFNEVSTSLDDSSSITPESIPSEQLPMNMYQSVLLNKATFYSTDIQKQLYISQLNQTISSDSSVQVETAKFAMVDLDKDDIPEIILWLTANFNDDFGFEVLHYKDGGVYGYTLWYRTFMDLKEDGTFSFLQGASESGYGTITFTKDGYTIDEITYSKLNIYSDNKDKISYFVNKASASYDEYLSAIIEQSRKADASWYNLTDKNIVKFLSN